VHECLVVEGSEHTRAFLVGERPWRARSRLALALRFLRAVVARATDAERETRGDDADERDQECKTLHHRFLRSGPISRRPGRNRPAACAKSSSVGSGSVSPNSAATFRWTSTGRVRHRRRSLVTLLHLRCDRQALLTRSEPVGALAALVVVDEVIELN